MDTETTIIPQLTPSELLDVLIDSFHEVRGAWDVFHTLFRCDQKRVDDLIAVDEAFFGYVFSSIADATFLGLCRLSDPQKTGSSDNVSIDALVDRIEGKEQWKAHGAELGRLAEDFVRSCKPVRVRRNKRIAHSDLKCAIETIADGVTPAVVDHALRALRAFLNKARDVVGCQNGLESIAAIGGSALLERLGIEQVAG